MSELTREQLETEIAQCDKAFLDLKRYQELGTLEYLREHPDIYYAVCYRFISAIESLFDVGQYVLLGKGARAEGQREIPTLLGQKGVIPKDLVERFKHMYGFRNRLVHAYGTLDDERVAEYLAKRLGDIEEVLVALKAASA